MLFFWIFYFVNKIKYCVWYQDIVNSSYCSPPYNVLYVCQFIIITLLTILEPYSLCTLIAICLLYTVSKTYTKICCWKFLYYVLNLQIIVQNEVHYVKCTTQNAVIPLYNLTGITLYWHQNDDQSVFGYKLVQLIVNHTQWNTSYCYLLK